MAKPKQPVGQVGDDSVVVGPHGNVGHRSVVWTASDENGNTILNRPAIIGAGASGEPNDLVIGANASSSQSSVLANRDSLISDLVQLARDLMKEVKSPECLDSLRELDLAYKAVQQDDLPTALTHFNSAKVWIATLANNVGATLIAEKIGQYLDSFTQ